jgi:hypothetical protein
MEQATLTFPNMELAKQFTSYWARTTLEGHDMSAVKSDGSFDVTVYNVDSDRKQCIETFIDMANESLQGG